MALRAGDAIQKLFQSLGGKLESLYYAFGDDDLYVIADMSDNVSTVTGILTVTATGAVSTKTVVLLTAEEIDQAVKKTGAYRPPGQ